VTVSGAPLVQETESHAVSTVVDDKEIWELPLKMEGTTVHGEQFVFLTLTDRVRHTQRPLIEYLNLRPSAIRAFELG
jgi:hypothetical protein